MINAFIKGTGSYAPSNVVTNDYFEKVGSNDAWIYKNLGIKYVNMVAKINIDAEM